MTNENEKDSWELESEIEHDRIYSPNINPEVPKELWDNHLWEAVRATIRICMTREEVLRMVKRWNMDNNPRISELELVRKTLWALNTWDTKFKPIQ